MKCVSVSTVWHTWRMSEFAVVQLCIHAQSVCVSATRAYAVLQRLSGWHLSSCPIACAAHWLFCHVDCSGCLMREACLTATEGCPVDWFVMGHTHMNTRTHAHAHNISSYRETHTCAQTHIAWGCVSQLPGEAAGSGFIAYIDRGSGCVKGSICGLKRGADSSVLR